MLLAKNIELLEKTIASWKAEGLRIGFVPTMGALHLGHLSLIQQALEHCDRVVCSIFVNPTQFNNLNDLASYPIEVEKDLELLQTIGCHLAFTPSRTEMYPEGEKSTSFKLSKLDTVMEGAHRPGHFDGVCTIVSKLFEAVQPQMAFFGQKDYQQLAIIQELNRIKSYNITIVGCPIVREKDGLAMSSRNALLKKEERLIAARIYQVLKEAKTYYKTNTVSNTEKWVYNSLKQTPEFQIDYTTIADTTNLQKVTSKQQDAILCVAVYLGSVRLIDNILLNN